MEATLHNDVPYCSGLLTVILAAALSVCGCSQYAERHESADTAVEDFTSAAPHGITPDTFIEIILEGGGYYGGENPTIVTRYEIRGDGEISIRNMQYYTDDATKKLQVPAQRIRDLARSLLDDNLMLLGDLYDCSEDNADCEYRKNHYPPAIPLHLQVTIGDARKDITVTVFERELIDYPENLENIVDKIFDFIRSVEE